MHVSSPFAERERNLPIRSLEKAVNRYPATAFLSNVSWMLWANIAQVAVQFGMLLALTRCTDLATVGRFAYASAIVNPLMLLAQMQLRSLQIVDVGRRFSFVDYLVFRIVAVCVAILLIVFLSQLHSAEVSAIILATVVVRVAEAISDVFQGSLQQMERFRAIGISTTLRSFLGGTGFVVAVSYYQDLNTAMLVLASMSLLATFGIDSPIWLQASRASDPSSEFVNRRTCFANVCQIAITAFPLGCATFLAAIEANLPRYFLSLYASEEAIGIFSTIVAYANMGTILINAIAQSAAPRLARLRQSGQLYAFNKTVGLLAICGFTIGLLGILGAAVVGKMALALVFGKYEPIYFSLLLIILAGTTLCYTHIFLGTALLAAKLYKIKFQLQFAAACSSVVILALTTPSFQLHGAAISFLSTSAIALFLHAVVFIQFVRKEGDIEVNRADLQSSVRMCA